MGDHQHAAELALYLISFDKPAWRDIEVIVVNDGSTDASAEILSRFPRSVTVINQANLGVTAARQRAFERSTGEFIQYLDADDLSHRTRSRFRPVACLITPAA